VFKSTKSHAHPEATLAVSIAPIKQTISGFGPQDLPAVDWILAPDPVPRRLNKQQSIWINHPNLILNAIALTSSRMSTSK
jgi:hypothetical protein